MTDLHLIDDETLDRSPTVGAHLSDLVARDGGRVLVLGRGHGARRLGLTEFDCVDIPTPPAPLVGRRVRRAVRRCGALGRVISWSPRAGRHAASLGIGYRRRSHTLEPMVIDATRLDGVDGASVRGDLGAEPDDVVVWLMGDRPGRANAMAAIQVIGLAAEAGLKTRLLVSPTADRLNQARRVVETMGRAERLIVDERAAEPWAVLAGCDAALSASHDAVHERLSAAWSRAAGVAIVRLDEGGRRGGAQRLVELAGP